VSVGRRLDEPARRLIPQGNKEKLIAGVPKASLKVFRILASGVWENWKKPASGEWIRTFADIFAAEREAEGLIDNLLKVAAE